MPIHIKIRLHVNRLVRYFIGVDLLLMAGWGLIDPLFSLFIIDRIEGATIVSVGIAVAIYWVAKSLIQIVVGAAIDAKPGEKDDFYVLVLGIFVIAASAFLYPLVAVTWQLYVLQLVRATGFALILPSWAAIFSRHMDKDEVAFEWSLDSTAFGLAGGVSGLIGSIIAEAAGFNTLFVLAGIISLATAFLLLLTPGLILPSPNRKVVVKPPMVQK